MSSPDAWEDLVPASADESWETVLSAINHMPFRWSRIYLRVLRHTDTYGVDETVRRMLRHASPDFEDYMRSEGWAREVADARRRRTEANLAAAITDDLATAERERRDTERPRRLASRSRSASASPHTPGPEYYEPS